MRAWSNGTIRMAMAACVALGGWAAHAEVEGPIPPGRIRTIFETKCIGCHGADKQAGDLRLDSIEAVQKGGKSGPLFVAAKPDESALVQRITLPEGDDELMPKEGGPLPGKDIEAIKKWVADGASFEAWADAYTEPQLMFAALTVSGGTPATALFVDDTQKKIAEGLAPIAPEVLAPITDAGIRLAPIDQVSPLLQADLKFVPEGAKDEHLALLAPAAANITWLNLAGSQVTDGGLAPLAGMPRLTSLHLERTGITDAGLAHLVSLANLEYLNLFGTKVTDAGLETLKALPSLKRLYVWQTGVTAAGAQALAAALPALVVNMGTEQKPLEQLVYNDPAADLAKMEAEKAAAAVPPADGAPAAAPFDPFAPKQ